MDTDNPKNEPPAVNDIANELRELGRNLAGMLQTAWESEERKRLQEELRSGLADLGTTLNEAASEFKGSETGQRLKDDMEDFRTRLRSGEVESKMRTEIVNALRIVNSELEKAKQKTTGSSEDVKGE